MIRRRTINDNNNDDDNNYNYNKNNASTLQHLCSKLCPLGLVVEGFLILVVLLLCFLQSLGVPRLSLSLY